MDLISILYMKKSIVTILLMQQIISVVRGYGNICKDPNTPRASIQMRVSLDITFLEQNAQDPRQLVICIGEFSSPCNLLPKREVTLYPSQKKLIIFNTTSLDEFYVDASLYYNSQLESEFKNVFLSAELAREQTLHQSSGIARSLEIQVTYTCLRHHTYNRKCDVCCQPQENIYTCNATTGQKICSSGYTLKDNDCVPIQCYPGVCRNGGDCILNNGGFTCKCLPQYSGDLCGDWYPCNSSPCLNGGICIEQKMVNDLGYRCDCPEKFLGQQCHIPITTTSKPNPFFVRPTEAAINVKTSPKMSNHITSASSNQNFNLTVILILAAVFFVTFFVFAGMSCFFLKKRQEAATRPIKESVQLDESLPTFQRFRALDQQDSLEHHSHIPPEYFCTLPLNLSNNNNGCCLTVPDENGGGITYMHNTLPYPSAFRTPYMKMNPYSTLPHSHKTSDSDNFGHFNQTYTMMSPMENDVFQSSSAAHQTATDKDAKPHQLDDNNPLPPSMALLRCHNDPMSRMSEFVRLDTDDKGNDNRSRFSTPVHHRYTPVFGSSGAHQWSHQRPSPMGQPATILPSSSTMDPGTLPAMMSTMSHFETPTTSAGLRSAAFSVMPYFSAAEAATTGSSYMHGLLDDQEVVYPSKLTVHCDDHEIYPRGGVAADFNQLHDPSSSENRMAISDAHFQPIDESKENANNDTANQWNNPQEHVTEKNDDLDNARKLSIIVGEPQAQKGAANSIKQPILPLADSECLV